MTIAEPQPFSMTSMVIDGVGQLRLAGEFDAVGAEQFDARLANLGELRQLFIDVQDVTFVDSMAIRSLVRCHEQLKAVGGTMTLDRPSEPVQRLLHLVGLEPVFDITGVE